MAKARQRIIVHTLEDMIAALQAAKKAHVVAELMSAEGAAHYAGVGYLKEMMAQASAKVPGVEYVFYVDCGDDSTTAISAMREGLRDLILTFQTSRLRNLAKRYGTSLHLPQTSTKPKARRK